jgi:dTDP-4-dehydrorhamnose reductase
LLSSGSEYINKRKQDAVYTFDIRDKKTLAYILGDEKPDYVINTAALTDVDACEDNKKLAMELNAILPESLAVFANKYKFQLISFSTDYIYDGKKGPYTEDELPNPLSYYGKSKLAGENAVRIEAEKRSTIVRTNVVYSNSSYNKGDFIHWVLNALKEEKPLKIIDGQWCNPTLADDIAKGLYKIITKKSRGIYNFAGRGYYNRYQIALLIADIFKLDKALITKIPSSDLKQKAVRPERGGLVNLKAETMLGMKFSDLETGLVNLKHQLNKESK